MNVSAESVKVGDRVWLDCVVTGEANAKIEFSKVGADKLPDNAQVGYGRLKVSHIVFVLFKILSHLNYHLSKS